MYARTHVYPRVRTRSPVYTKTAPHLTLTSTGLTPIIPATSLNVRILSCADLAQFKHLSFQEALAVQDIVVTRAASFSAWASDRAAAAFVNDPFNHNLVHG